MPKAVSFTVAQKAFQFFQSRTPNHPYIDKRHILALTCFLLASTYSQ